MVSAKDIRKASILIVDDQEANVSLLEQILLGAEYESVASTKDPHEVCALHDKNHYDLILLDLQMPGMDGFAVMESLKKIEKGGYLPVLVITAQPDHKMRALKAGAKDFVSKPFDLAEVLVRVYNMLEVRLLHLNGTISNIARLENSQRIAGLGDWEYELAGKHRLRWSDEVYEILGISRRDYAPNAETFYQRVHPDDVEFVREEKRFTVRKSRVDFEHRIIRPNGAVRYIRQVAEMTFDDGGQPDKESGTIQDITDRKISEGALRESEERYRTMLTLSPDAIFVHVDGFITFVNKAFCDMMGAADPSQLIGKVALDVAHPAFHEQVIEQRYKGGETLPVLPLGLKFVRLDGSSVDVETTSMAIEFHGHREYQIIARDITARLRAETALRESEETVQVRGPRRERRGLGLEPVRQHALVERRVPDDLWVRRGRDRAQRRVVDVPDSSRGPGRVVDSIKERSIPRARHGHRSTASSARTAAIRASWTAVSSFATPRATASGWWGACATSRSSGRWRTSPCAPSAWTALEPLPAASRTTSTMCSPPS
jgi:PAS domain S-box-containing protein